MIAIPNMEMPKDCWECQMFGTWEEVGKFSCFLGAKVKDIDIRPTDCPLIDIVRRGECKYWTGDCTNEIWQSPTDDYLPQTNADDFCPYGKRRANETDRR